MLLFLFTHLLHDALILPCGWRPLNYTALALESSSAMLATAQIPLSVIVCCSLWLSSGSEPFYHQTSFFLRYIFWYFCFCCYENERNNLSCCIFLVIVILLLWLGSMKKYLCYDHVVKTLSLSLSLPLFLSFQHTYIYKIHSTEIGRAIWLMLIVTSK